MLPNGNIKVLGFGSCLGLGMGVAMLNCPMCRHELDPDNQDHALAISLSGVERDAIPTGKLMKFLASIAPDAGYPEGDGQ